MLYLLKNFFGKLINQEISKNSKNIIYKKNLHQLQAGERDIPFLACWGDPKPQMQIFLKFAKCLRRDFSFFWNIIFIVLYINFTIKNKTTFDKILD